MNTCMAQLLDKKISSTNSATFTPTALILNIDCSSPYKTFIARFVRLWSTLIRLNIFQSEPINDIQHSTPPFSNNFVSPMPLFKSLSNWGLGKVVLLAKYLNQNNTTINMRAMFGCQIYLKVRPTTFLSFYKMLNIF